MIEEYKYYGQPHGKPYLVLREGPYVWETIEVDGIKALYIVLNDDANLGHDWFDGND